MHEWWLWKKLKMGLEPRALNYAWHRDTISSKQPPWDFATFETFR